MLPVLVRASLLFLGVALLVGVHPGPAKADPTQLCRSITSITLAPLDVGLGPVIAAKDMWYGMSEWSDPLLLRLIAVPPGYLYLNALQFGGAALRVISGGFEFPLGLISLPREGAQGALFKSQDDTWSLYSADFGPCPIRIGSSYNTINE